MWLLILGSITCLAQTSSTRYYSSEWLDKEVKPEKAKFSETVTVYPDSTETRETKDLKSGEVFRRESFKGKEPIGVWITPNSNGQPTMNYDFPLVYNALKCNDTLPVKVPNWFDDKPDVDYVAPKFEGGESLFKYIQRKIIYPQRPKEEGIQGKVYIAFTITKEGTVENVFVMRGKDVALDKEAVRVIREMKFSSPALLKGQPQKLCLQMPLSFQLR